MNLSLKAALAAIVALKVLTIFELRAADAAISLEYKYADTNRYKCGVTAFTNEPCGLRRYYRQEDYLETRSSDESDTGESSAWTFFLDVHGALNFTNDCIPTFQTFDGEAELHVEPSYDESAETVST